MYVEEYFEGLSGGVALTADGLILWLFTVDGYQDEISSMSLS